MKIFVLKIRPDGTQRPSPTAVTSYRGSADTAHEPWDSDARARLRHPLPPVGPGVIALLHEDDHGSPRVPAPRRLQTGHIGNSRREELDAAVLQLRAGSPDVVAQ